MNPAATEEFGLETRRENVSASLRLRLRSANEHVGLYRITCEIQT
jgi:hypothetical protein